MRRWVHMTERITITYKGASYEGTRTVSGVRKLSQTISYRTRSKADSHSYRSDEGVHMALIAEVILRELVEEDLGST